MEVPEMRMMLPMLLCTSLVSSLIVTVIVLGRDSTSPRCVSVSCQRQEGGSWDSWGITSYPETSNARPVSKDVTCLCPAHVLAFLASP